MTDFEEILGRAFMVVAFCGAIVGLAILIKFAFFLEVCR